MGEDNTGKLDLGIFIASIVPDGPADKDGRIKPGMKQWKQELEASASKFLYMHHENHFVTRGGGHIITIMVFCGGPVPVDFAGGRLISLNKTSLEGVTFSDAAAILQNSPEEVELIVSQPKCKG